jgi:hypothetical protein
MELQEKFKSRLKKSSFNIVNLSEIIKRLKIKKEDVPELILWLENEKFQKYGDKKYYLNFK